MEYLFLQNYIIFVVLIQKKCNFATQINSYKQKEIKIMKKLALLVVFTALMGLVAFSQQDNSKCPFGGRENCKGQCGHFTDENKDSYCDYAKLNEKTKDIVTDTEKKHCGKHDKDACDHKDKKDKKCCKALDNKCKENNGECTKKGGCSTPECTNNKDKKHCDKEMKSCDKDKKHCDKEMKSCDKDKKHCDKEMKSCDKDKKSCDKEKKEHSCDKDKKCEGDKKHDCKHKNEK